MSIWGPLAQRSIAYRVADGLLDLVRNSRVGMRVLLCEDMVLVVHGVGREIGQGCGRAESLQAIPKANGQIRYGRDTNLQ